MPLPTVDDCKKYLRIEHADEDQIVSQLLARAKASIEAAIGYPFTAAELTYVDYANKYAGRMIQLPGPFAITPTPPVVTDGGGSVVAATGYLLDGPGGKIHAKNGTLGTWPSTVVATVGLSAHPDYASRLEAVAAVAIVELVAHYYQNRNPAVQSQGDEGGGSVSLTDAAIPERIVQDLMVLPCTSQMLFA